VISPFGDRAFVSNATGGSVGVIDTASDSLIASWDIPNAGTLAGIDVSYLGDKLYVVDSQWGRVYVLNAYSGVVIDAVFAGTGDPWGQSWEVEVFPTWAGAFAYVTVPEGDVVKVVDIDANGVSGTFPVGDGPRGLALFPPETTCATRVFVPLVIRAFP
jgi:DNA-binding beta-propeller fold protein YncE